MKPLLSAQPQPRTQRATASPALARLGLGVLSLGVGLSLAPAGRADVVLMRTGSRIECTRAVEESTRMRLELAGGGVLHVAIADVKRIENGSGTTSSRGSTMRMGRSAPGAADTMVAQSSDRRFDPVGADRSLASPVEAEVAYRRAAEAGKAPVFPTVVGAMSGVQPMPAAPQLRTQPDHSQMDAQRRAYAERSRITPGSAGALLGRVSPGSMSSGGARGTDNLTGRDAPRVPR